jgi:hypothetical protein
MISIDESLRRAASAAATWSSAAAREVAATLARSPGAKVDWDEGAGEEWLRVFDGPSLVALISVALPFVFIQRDDNGSERLNGDLAVVAVDDFDEVQLSCSLEVLEGAFGASDRLGSLNPEGFSANDLWYSTI